MNGVISKEWLHQHLNDKNIRVVDCRFNLSDAEKGYHEYLQDHLPGAVYFHLNKDLSKPISAHGGRHPLPEMEDFKQTLQQAGVSEQTVVIAYDHGEGFFASRLWWMLHYVGHEKVFVLDGGYYGWKEAGYHVEREIPSYEQTKFEINVNSEYLASYEQVKKLVENKDEKTILIDSRDKNRYLGKEELIDLKSGHIPGAINKPWMDSYEKGLFKPSEEQDKRFEEFDKSTPIIVYCGSGVSAIPNFMALKSAGYKDVKLYAGSFSDWISYEENEVETGE